jgi:[ribosomal protein S5]-alanine N-acetyltransferase
VPRLLPPVLPADTLAAQPQPTFTVGDELTLRPWASHDAAALVDAYDDPHIRHWHHRSLSPTEASAWIDASRQTWSAETDAEWAATLDGEVVGRVALRDIRLLIGQAELSYWTLPAARARGIASRAVAHVARWALDEVGFWRLEVRHSTRNAPSCRVATRAGFDLEATLQRQHVHADGWHDVHVHTRFRVS